MNIKLLCKCGTNVMTADIFTKQFMHEMMGIAACSFTGILPPRIWKVLAARKDVGYKQHGKQATVPTYAATFSSCLAAPTADTSSVTWAHAGCFAMDPKASLPDRCASRIPSTPRDDISKPRRLLCWIAHAAQFCHRAAGAPGKIGDRNATVFEGFGKLELATHRPDSELMNQTP